MQMRHTQYGLSIIELMVAMTIGLLIMIGLSSLFIQTKQSFRQDELVAHMQEEARFALNEIAADAAMSGFWGPIVDGAQIENHANIAAGTHLDETKYKFPVMASDNVATAGATFDWTTLNDAVTGSDSVSVRRLAGLTTAAADLDDDAFYLETNGTTGDMVYGSDADTASADIEHWEYKPVIYYVRSFCRDGDGIPSLVKQYWDAGVLQTSCVAQGIENMQVEYGVDTNGDSYPNRYVTAVDTSNSHQVSTIRIFLLARATREDQEYSNTRSYTISNANSTAKNDRFYRRVYSTTVQARNLINLRSL